MVGLMYLRPTGGEFYYGTVFGCVDARLSLHAISAELAKLGYRICVETIYRACYGCFQP